MKMARLGAVDSDGERRPADRGSGAVVGLWDDKETSGDGAAVMDGDNRGKDVVLVAIADWNGCVTADVGGGAHGDGNGETSDGTAESVTEDGAKRVLTSCTN